MSDDNVSYEMGYEGLDAMFAGDDEPPLPPSPDSPTEQQHSSFLDLTNGEGGAKKRRSTSRYATYPAAPEEDSDSDDGGGRSTPPPARRKKAEPPAAAADSNTTATPGKVVPPGQEATGRWTQEEHQAFLNGLRMYGKEWKKVAAKVKTRTVVQTRTHAQKYFQKLHKAMETGDTSEITSVDMGVAADVKKASEKKKAKRAQSAKLKREQSTASTHAAANLMGLSNTKMESSEATSNATFGQPTESLPTHGFSTHQGHSPMAGYTSSGLFDSPGMKILAPQHDMAMRMGKFPEPSPAATGKRRLAEMAAAQMLAGVTSTFSMPPMLPGVDDGDVTPPEEGTGAVARFPSLPPLYQGQEEEPAAKKSALSLQILNPETLGIAHDTKANRGGAESPTTPWDGQLEALLRYVNEG
jgi:SHAQKYF class myb-like DNA-binding protein